MTNTLVIDGNLTADPDFKILPNGQSVANFTVAHTPRKLNRNTNEWEDGVTVFLEGAIWGKKAEAFAEAFTKGTTVLATGALAQQNWDDKQTGAKRSKIVFTVDTVAKIERNKASGNTQGGNTQGGW